MAINYHRGMSERGEFIHPQLATELLRRHLNPLVKVTDVRKLYGGSTSRVLEFILDREPGSVVAKVHDAKASGAFNAEMQSLRFFREHTHFPVPEPLAHIEGDEGFDGSMLILQKVNGKTLESCQLSPRDRQAFQVELAAAVAELHKNKAERFGNAVPEQTHDSWLDLYGPTVEKTASQTRSLLPSASRAVLDHITDHLDQWLGHNPTPTLIHGDLWGNNILVDDARPSQPHILAFIDGQASYADVEYELAYLELFRTAGPDFFDFYTKTHKIDKGYRYRSRVYWLITLLQNTRRYGEKYVPQCEKVAQELRQFSR